ncbi:MAG: hypothetical protein Ct9H300mP28_38040 [Pseudomonadota bacterium]|nr:MAG: hypothetical protein Ct9H300mP28_38040 [Pseudomonadota bacterium]
MVKGLGSFGSRSLFVGGTALLEGTKEFLQKSKELAAEELEAARMIFSTITDVFRLQALL